MINLTIATAFFITQVDLAEPFEAFSQHHKRTTVRIWLLVFCCATTTCISIKVMEDYSTPSFIQSFVCFWCQYGYSFKLLIDEDGQLIKGCQTMKFDLIDLQQRLHQDMHFQYQTCPVGGHNMHGQVERKIKSIRKSLETNLHLHRLSIIQWETLVSVIGNSINNMPLAIGNITADVETADLITPNRLLLGRNNDRSPTGNLYVVNDSIKLIRDNQKIFNAWFDAWLTSHVPSLIRRLKWFDSSRDLKKGDSNHPRPLPQRCEEMQSINDKISTWLVVIQCVDELDFLNELNECYENSK